MTGWDVKARNFLRSLDIEVLKFFPFRNTRPATRNGNLGYGIPVEIEFAVNLSVQGGVNKEFALLQMRPLLSTARLKNRN